ncbi:MAG TPA: hypothetical protein VG603_16215, partial [Chitinophagales bacterium]|nr:hypothetical protein [Chitinophagales bacterium]
LFNEPEQVFVYPGFLETLPFRELQSGFAEIIKHYLIADAPAFDELYKENKPLAEFDWPPTIEKSIAIKSTIVAQDPLEHGARKALNFGHTIGHAVESLFMEKGEGRLLHGEAVAIGVLAEGFISKKLTGLQNDELEKMAAAIGKYYTLPVVPPNDFGKVLDYISQDKKNAGGGNNFTLLKSIGNYCINNNVEEGLITDSLKYYNSLQA